MLDVVRDRSKQHGKGPHNGSVRFYIALFFKWGRKPLGRKGDLQTSWEAIFKFCESIQDGEYPRKISYNCLNDLGMIQAEGIFLFQTSHYQSLLAV